MSKNWGNHCECSDFFVAFELTSKHSLNIHSGSAQSVPKTRKPQFSGYFSCEKPSKVSQKPKNSSFRDTFPAKSSPKCPKNPKIPVFGTLFIRKAVQSVPKTQKSRFLGHFSYEKPSKVSQKPKNPSFRDTFHAQGIHLVVCNKKTARVPFT